MSELSAIRCQYFLALVPCNITILVIDVVWSVVTCAGTCRVVSRGAGLPPVFAEMWLKVYGGDGEDALGPCELEVLLGVVGQKGEHGHTNRCGAS